MVAIRLEEYPKVKANIKRLFSPHGQARVGKNVPRLNVQKLFANRQTDL